jgi:hypothetical protein
MARPPDALDLLLDSLGPLTEDQLFVLIEAWHEQDEAARRRAWTRAKAEISRRRLDRSLERARHHVARWAAAGRNDYHGIGGLLGLPSQDARLRTEAAPAVLDAVAGLLVGDALEDDERLALLAPWRALDEDSSPTV